MAVDGLDSRQPKRIAIIGGGSRGHTFANFMLQNGHRGRVVAVAEPREDYRRSIQKMWSIPDDNAFAGWEDFFARPRFCDGVIISTMDREHVGPALAALHAGYDVLLEKPMAVTLEDCRSIEAAQRKGSEIFTVCHSLRYQKGFAKLKELVASGIIGVVITVDQIEQVELFHQAHSFVRGNWANQSRATFMLLSKSCHDIDYLCYLVDKPCLSVCSYGGLSYFRHENGPPGATRRCVDCPVEPGCIFSAIKFYVQGDRTAWPASVVAMDHSYEGHMEAIRRGPYGRCVWKCDNDVVDHQVVAMRFADEVTATFTMTGFTGQGGRRTRVHGTEGEIYFDEKSGMTVGSFGDRNVQHIELGREIGGHGGGDARVVREWLWAMHTRDPSRLVASAQESLKTHTVVFAAERSRLQGRSILLSEM